jgi:phosphoribosylglycinamide formyltransferase-1
MQKMAVLLSGSGRTLDNFHERIQDGSLNAEIKVVISNIKDVLAEGGKVWLPEFSCEGQRGNQCYFKGL